MSQYRPPRPAAPMQGQPGARRLARANYGESMQRGSVRPVAPPQRRTPPMQGQAPVRRVQGHGGATRPPASRARARRGWRPAHFLLLLVLLAVLCLGSFFFIIYRDVNRQVGVFYDGIYVSGIHLGGMNPDQAMTALAQAEEQRLTEWKITMRYQDTAKTLDRTDIDLHLNLVDQLNAAWTIGRSGDLMERRRVITGLREQPYTSEGGVFFDEAKLDTILAEVQKGLTTEPVDASSTFDPVTGGFVFQQEQTGTSLDIAPVREQIEQAIYALSSTEVVLSPQIVAPEVTAGALRANNTLIVSAETVISKSSEDGRNENIRVALEKFDGLKVMPNESVSFNKIAGKRTEKNGYKEALEIEYGEYVYGIGGGVCQVSTTLYQAVLRAGLKVEKRQPHAIPANYCEMGQDATVTDNGKDFVFRNNTDSPIYINAGIAESGNTNKCSIEIYGKPLEGNIRYTLESQQVGLDIPPEPPIKYEKDVEQKYVVYEDEEEEVTKARMGHRVITFLVTQRADDNMEIGRTQIGGEDLYPPAPAKVFVGTQPRIQD